MVGFNTCEKDKNGIIADGEYFVVNIPISLKISYRF